MNLEAELLGEHSRRNADRIARWVGNDPSRFRQLMDLLLHGEEPVPQRAAWAVGVCADRYPGLLGPWMRQLVDLAVQPGVHGAIPRNILRILQYAEVPARYAGKLVCYCLEVVADPAAAPAIRANAMTVLVNAVKRQPALAHEVEETLAHIYGSTPAISVRMRMALSAINGAKKKEE